MVLKALAREPGDRFAGAGELADALRQALPRPGAADASTTSQSGVQKPVAPQTAELRVPDVGLSRRYLFPWWWMAGIGVVVIASLLAWEFDQRRDYHRMAHDGRGPLRQ